MIFYIQLNIPYQRIPHYYIINVFDKTARVAAVVVVSQTYVYQIHPTFWTDYKVSKVAVILAVRDINVECNPKRTLSNLYNIETTKR